MVTNIIVIAYVDPQEFQHQSVHYSLRKLLKKLCPFVDGLLSSQSAKRIEQ